MMQVKLKGITHGYAGAGEVSPVLRDITLDIDPGAFVVVVGPSGCGKSTLLRLIAGLDRPQSGRVFFGDDDVTMLPARQRNVAMVFQSYALYPHLSVRGNLELALRMARLDEVERRSRVDRVAAFLELTPVLDRRPAALSGGQRQRVAMGRALVRRPGVFLFDEPLSNLDADLRTRLRAQIKVLHGEFPATKIYVTHDQVEAMTLADVVIVLKDGVIQQMGSPAEIYESPANLFVAQFFGSPPINLLGGIGGAQMHCRSADVPSDSPLRRLVDGHWIAGIRPEDVICAASSEALGAAGHCALVSGTVKDADHLGATSIIHLETRLGPLSALASRSPADRGPRLGPGADAHVAFPVDRILWFERSSGRRLGTTQRGTMLQ